jgi:hypothetical protein
MPCPEGDEPLTPCFNPMTPPPHAGAQYFTLNAYLSPGDDGGACRDLWLDASIPVPLAGQAPYTSPAPKHPIVVAPTSLITISNARTEATQRGEYNSAVKALGVASGLVKEGVHGDYGGSDGEGILTAGAEMLPRFNPRPKTLNPHNPIVTGLCPALGSRC